MDASVMAQHGDVIEEPTGRLRYLQKQNEAGGRSYPVLQQEFRATTYHRVIEVTKAVKIEFFWRDVPIEILLLGAASPK